jgi:hypothetical protein
VLLRLLAIAMDDPFNGLDERFDRCVPDLMPVETGLPDVAHREAASGPHTARVGFAVGLEDRYPQSRSPSSIAQSSEEGPRSPRGPGCTIRQRRVDQIDSGIICFRNGQTISCGSCSRTAASMATAELTTATATL